MEKPLMKENLNPPEYEFQARGPPPPAYNPSDYSVPLTDAKSQAAFNQVPPGAYSQNPPAPYDQNPSGPYNQNPPGPYNQNPPGPYNQNPPGPYNQNPPVPYNQNPPVPYNQPVVHNHSQYITTAPPAPAATSVNVISVGAPHAQYLNPGVCTVCRKGKIKDTASFWTWLWCILCLPTGILPSICIFCCCCRHPKCSECGYTVG